MMRRVLLCSLVTVTAWASLPAWWGAFLNRPSLEGRFRQESESKVFGKLTRQGTLLLAGHGRLRVVYETGLTITCDGRHLIQYDPDTRTAQRVELARAVRDFPLLSLLLDPKGLDRLYRVEARGDAVQLVPKEVGLPEVQLTGREGRLRALAWTDPTGARQSLEVVDPRPAAPHAPSVFRFQPPPGTRWSTPNG